MDPGHADRFLRTTASAATANLSDPQTVLHQAFRAVIQGNFDAFAESIADDIELSIRGFGILDGYWRGRHDVIGATRKNFALLENQKPEIESIISQGNQVAVLLRESGVFQSTGQPYNVRGVEWFTFTGGKISKIDEIIVAI